jgi:hypothetical protein
MRNAFHTYYTLRVCVKANHILFLLRATFLSVSSLLCISVMELTMHGEQEHFISSVY